MVLFTLRIDNIRIENRKYWLGLVWCRKAGLTNDISLIKHDISSINNKIKYWKYIGDKYIKTGT